MPSKRSHSPLKRPITSLHNSDDIPIPADFFPWAFTVTMAGVLSLLNEATDIITQLEPLEIEGIFLDNSNQCHYAFYI
jgi:hypothetical protein